MTKKEIEKAIARMNANMLHWQRVDQAAGASHDVARAMMAAILNERDVLDAAIAKLNA